MHLKLQKKTIHFGKQLEKSDLILVMLFIIVFALPFLGGYYMTEKSVGKKVVGGILCVIGLAIWFRFGVH